MQAITGRNLQGKKSGVVSDLRGELERQQSTARAATLCAWTRSMSTDQELSVSSPFDDSDIERSNVASKHRVTNSAADSVTS